MRPYLRNNDYDNAVKTALKDITNLLQQDPKYYNTLFFKAFVMCGRLILAPTLLLAIVMASQIHYEYFRKKAKKHYQQELVFIFILSC
jgi:uncharacterized membrane protein YgcG